MHVQYGRMQIKCQQQEACVCRWLDAEGNSQAGAAWQKPEQVLQLPQGVRSVAAGMHSSAAISRDGQLWLWGKVISKVRDTVPLQQSVAV